MIKEILELEEKEERKPKEHKDRFYPTQSSCYITFQKYRKLYGTCLRAAYYSCTGQQEDSSFNGNSVKKKMGKYIEKMILDTLYRNGNIKEKKVSFLNEKYCISGELDAIFVLDDKEYGLEIKSIGGENCYINSLIFDNNSPKWQDLFQTLIYCYAFKEKLPNGFILLYIRRDTGDIKEFNIQIEPYKDKMLAIINGKPDSRFNVDDILQRYKLLKYYIDNKIIPPKDYIETYKKEDVYSYYKAGVFSKKQLEQYNKSPFGDSSCKFCNYKKTCSNEGSK
jgi:hypothetical protein